MNKNIFVKKQVISAMVGANLLFCITILSLQFYLHIKYPSLEWTNDVLFWMGIVLFWIGYSFFIFWLQSSFYPNKFISQPLEGVITTLGVLGCLALLVLSAFSLMYGTIKLDNNNEIARDITFFFRLFSINLIIVAILSLLLMIASFKLKSFITRNYFKSVSEAIHMIGKG